jgi:HSP20 family protein
MRIRELVPWRSHEKEHGLSQRTDRDPFGGLETQLGRYFDDFFEGFDLGSFGKSALREVGMNPKVDVAETKEAIQVTAELPGMTEKDIEVTLSDGHLVISGEKHAESEQKDKNYHRIERSFGSFRRAIALPAEVDDKKVDASFKNGVLSVTLPKVAPSAASGKKIEVKRTP